MNRSDDYTRAELVAGLRAAGLADGDLVFVHAGLDTLGHAHGCATDAESSAMLLGALEEVVGAEGTILVPTYTFSLCRQELFDVQRTPTEGGPWSTFAPFLEYVRTRPGTVRSHDPIHSVAGRGPLAAELLADVPNTCFGAGSVFDRLHAAGGKLCMIGVGLHEASFQHHVEEMVGVPFRFKKLFTGRIRDNGTERKTGWIYNVRLLADSTEPDDTRLERVARAEGVCQAASVGRGEVLVAGCDAYYDIIARELARDPWYSARGPARDPLDLEAERVPPRRFPVALPPAATMGEMVDRLWRLPRDIVSDAYDAALAALATQLPMTIHEYPTGTECWSWLIPEKWACHEAYLETLDGRRIFSYADHPLHVVSYSLPFDGVVPRDELMRHLHVHHQSPDAIPFIFKYYERDWGLCCSKRLRDTLIDDAYRVVIRTSFSYGHLKVGEVVVPGETDECIVLCAHLCHPGMFNDDLSGVVVGIDVMRALMQRRDLHYTYRLLIVPETIGSVAWLSRNEELIPRLRAGLFLEMLGTDTPHALQLSFDPATSEADECFTLALKAHDPYGWTGAFRTVIGNDERQFNAPGVRVPMLSLSRVLPLAHRHWPYLGYHSSLDTPALGTVAGLEASRDLVLRMLETMDANAVPVPRFKGEVFCSRYGVHIDWWENREANESMFDVMFLIDGTRTIARIANECKISFEAARSTIDVLRQHGLVTLTRPGEPVPGPSEGARRITTAMSSRSVEHAGAS